MHAARLALFEDNHIHSKYSDGKNAIGELLAYNDMHDQLNLTISDHVNKETDWFPRYCEEIRQYRKQYPHFAIRIGCEAKILEDGTLNTTPEIIEAADTVIGSVHHFRNIRSLGKEELLEQEFTLTKMIAAHPDVDVLGHPFSMCNRFFKLNPPMAYVEEIYQLCVENGILFEFNEKQALGSIRELVTREIGKGNIRHFSFGTDLHENTNELGNAAFALGKPVTVLLTGAGAGVGQSILKALRLSKVKTRIIIADMDPLTAGLYRADAAYVIPAANDPKYIPHLEAICKKEQVELLLVGTDVELPVLARHKADFQRNTATRIIVSDNETIAIADDKWKTTEFLRSHGFPFIRSALPKDVDTLMRDVGFPLVVKPRVGARSVGFAIAHDEPELRELLRKTKDAIVQEYLPEEDEEYTCGGFFMDGECYGVIPMKRWLRNGDTYKAIAKHDPHLERFIERVGKTLKIDGPCNFQLRRSGDQWKIFEINCRFSGTTGAASALGFNVVNALLQHIFYDRPPYHLHFDEAYVFRYWNEVFAPVRDVETMTEGHLEGPKAFVSAM
jgi:carbamoyl-phosphate synthase large subunit